MFDEPSTVLNVRREAAKPAGGRQTHPALRIEWHRNVQRIGQVAVLSTSEPSDISRMSRPFDPAEDVVLSRAPFFTVVDRGGPVEIRPRETRMSIEINGRPFLEALTFSEKEVSAGIIILLAQEIVVCLHRLEFPVQRGPTLGFVGDSDAMERVRQQILSVADLDTTVLVRGATGSGKELVALAIQSQSKRASRPFVKISLADVPGQTATSALFGHERGAFTGAAQAHSGLFVQADGGTLFLDEVALAPPEVQNMLLRVLETGEVRALGSSRGRRVDVRVIAATDEKLEAAVEEGRFAEPLLFRLSGYEVRLPPLRERREDVGALLLHFLQQELAAVGESDQLASRALEERSWLEASDVARIAMSDLRGNVRGIRNLAKQLVISSRGARHARVDAVVRQKFAVEESSPAYAPSSSTSGQPGTPSDADIVAALVRSDFNFAAAAKLLGIHRATLYDRLRKNPSIARDASTLTDAEILESHRRHAGDVAAMAADLRVSRKRLAALLKRALSRHSGS